jgi:hypothetical protein
MRNPVPTSCQPPSDSVNRAVAIAARVCRWRYDLSLQEHLKERLSYDKNTLTLHGITCEEDHRFEYDELERSEVVVTEGLAARSSTILATFSAAGEVTVQQGKEHCLRLLIPCLVVASSLFPQACYEVKWIRLVPQKILGRAKRIIRLHNEPGWKKEVCVCVAQNGQLLVDSPGLQDLITFRNFFDD